MQHLLTHPLKVIRFFWLAGALFLLNLFILLGTKWYYADNQIDIVFHFLGGLFIAKGFIALLADAQERHALRIKDESFWRLLVVSLVGLAAVLWEFHEFLIDTYAPFAVQMQPSLTDTMGDLFLGLLGGIVATYVFRRA